MSAPTSPLDRIFGAGTEAQLVSEFTPSAPDDVALEVTTYGTGSDVRVLFDWTLAGAPYAKGEIVWRTVDGEIVFVNLAVEEPFRGQGFYKWIAGRWPWFRARGVSTFKALAPDGADFLPAGGAWYRQHEGEWKWQLPRS